ncbi:MAG: hypothetical protein U9O94_01800 [Nanoarchaeota archaeon]|nr:hypothetical protein [Nanoarchaeota archaeon]
MTSQSLIKYIKQEISTGYDINTIKKYLLNYGYTESQINTAVDSLYPNEVKHIIHPSKTTIALVVAIIFSLALLSTAFFIFTDSTKTPSQLLDLRITNIPPQIYQGQQLHFTIEVFNLGKAQRFDVPLRYEIYNLKDELITFKEETIALETKASSSITIDVSNIKTGSYYLKTTAMYAGKMAKATSSFKIIKETPQTETPVETPPQTTPPTQPTTPTTRTCPSSCDDRNECTNDYCDVSTDFICKHDTTYPCCGNNICEDDENYENCLSDCPAPLDKVDSLFQGKTVWEKVDIITEIAKSDKKAALEYCKEIEQTTYKYKCFTNVGISSKDENTCDKIEDEPSKDNCFKDVAKGTQSSDVCSKIGKDSKRDQCYMNFVTKGDYTLCSNLINKYLKQSCESLKKLSEQN